MLFFLSQRRGERKGCAGYTGLSDLGGLARKNISRGMRLSHAVYSLAKARRTQRNVRQILSYPKKSYIRRSIISWKGIR